MAEEEALRSLAAEFEERGFVVLPEALGSAQARHLSRVLTDDRQAHPEAWGLRGQEKRFTAGVAGFEGVGPVGEGGWYGCGCDVRLQGTRDDNLLLRTAAFDGLPAHPLVAALAERLIGPSACCKNLNVAIRDPIPEPPPPGSHAHWALWHRDQGGACMPSHPRHILSLQAIFLLTETRADTHCFSIVPESVAAKRRLPTRPHPRVPPPTPVRELADGTVEKMWRNHVPRPEGAYDFHAPAGTAILLNNSNVHAAVIRQSLEPRHTVHVYWGHRDVMPEDNAPPHERFLISPLAHRLLLPQGRGGGRAATARLAGVARALLPSRRGCAGCAGPVRLGTAASEYLNRQCELLRRLVADAEGGPLLAAARLAVTALRSGRSVHTNYYSGHNPRHELAEGRPGNHALFQPHFDWQESRRLFLSEGGSLARPLIPELAFYDELERGDVLFTVCCNRNIQRLRDRGVIVISVTTPYVDHGAGPEGACFENEDGLLPADVSTMTLPSHAPWNQVRQTRPCDSKRCLTAAAAGAGPPPEPPGGSCAAVLVQPAGRDPLDAQR